MKDNTNFFSRCGILFLLTAALLPTADLQGAEKTGNMLKNSSFEETEKGMPRHWAIIKRNHSGYTHKLDQKTVFDGKNSACLENRQDINGKYFLIWAQRVPKAFDKIPAGTKMEFSAMLRSEGQTAQGKIYFESVRARRTIVKRQKIAPGKWQKVSLFFTKEKIKYPVPMVYLQLEGKGKIFFDKVYFGPTRSQNIQTNGDIEKLNSAGMPLSWRKVERSKFAKTFIGAGFKSKNALGISGDKKPDKPVGWGQKFTAAQFAGIKPGSSLAVEFDMTAFANPAVQVRCYAEFMNGPKFVGTYGKNFSVYAGWERKKLIFPLISKKFTHVCIYFMLKTEGKACIDNIILRPHSKKEVTNNISDNYCRIKNMPPRRTWILPETPKKIELEYKIYSPELEVELAEIDGKRIKSWKFPRNTVGRVSSKILNLPALPAGAYELNFKSGKMVDTEWFAIRKKANANVHFTREGYMIFKGKKFFPIAMAHPNRHGKAGLDGLRVYAESGINMISEYQINSFIHAEYLNAVCNKFNFALWLKEDFGSRSQQKGKELRNYLKDLAARGAVIDNLVGLQSDEAAWSLWPLESIRRHSKYRFKYLPQYITWQCTAPRLTNYTDQARSNFYQVRRYAMAADVTGVDIYPVPEGRASHNNLPNQTLSCVGDYTDLIHKAVWNQRPIWMVLQGMSWREERRLAPTAEWPRPTREQLRFMVWNAITHGATGICWYGYGVWADQYSEWYRQFAEVNLELSEAAQLMLAGKAEKRPEVPPQVGVLHRSGILVFVNEHNKKAAKIKVPGKWFVSPSGKRFNFKEYTLKPYEVLLLTAKPLKLKPVKRFVPQNTTLDAIGNVEPGTHLINAQWVSHPDFLSGGKKKLWVKQKFHLSDISGKSYLTLSVDDKAAVKINGKTIAKDWTGHQNVNQYNLAGLLKKGNNLLEIDLYNDLGPCAVVFNITAGKTNIASGKSTLFSLDGKTWKKAHCSGKPPVAPWRAPILLIKHKQ